MERAFSETLERPVSIVVEFTRTAPPEPPDYQQRLTGWIAYKYRDHKFDALCPIRPQGLALAKVLRDKLWPGIPVIFGMAKNEYLSLGKLGPGLTGIYQDLSDEETIRNALQMLPKTGAIALVGGSSSLDRQINKGIIAFVRQSYPSVSLIDLTGLTIEAMAERANALPDNSILYQGSFSSDSDGRTITTSELSATLGAKANRPLFASSLLGFGAGPMGGPMNSYERGGEALGHLVGRVLRGERPDSIPVRDVSPVVAFDWRELRRWGVPASRIPAGAEVRFRELTFWEEHYLALSGTVAALLLQTLLIGILLFERQRRLRSEGATAVSEGLNRAVLSSLSGKIVILDSKGIVIRMSQDWKLDGPGSCAMPPVEVGGSYLESLRVLGGGEGEPQRLIEAVLSVLRGQSETHVGE